MMAPNPPTNVPLDLSGDIPAEPPTWESPSDATDQPIGAPTPMGDPGPSADAVITVRDLTKKYGQFTAVDGVAFDVPRGAIFGLIGPNGAGKSTTFSIVASLLKPTSGTVRVGGFDPAKETKKVRTIIGYMPDQLGVYGALTAEEYLKFFAAAYKIPRQDWPGLVDGLLELVGLANKADVDVDTMSRGMKQRMSLARALVHDPEVLILDEPASGLDPRARVELRELIQQLSAMGKTIVISSHILAELETVCTDVAILEGGRVLAAGAPAEIAGRLNTRRVEVTFSDGTIAEYPVADEVEQIRLLRHLVVDDERDVVAYSPKGQGLEDLFMEITEGGVR